MWAQKQFIQFANQNMYYLIIQNETFLWKKDGVVIQSLYIKRCNNDQLPSTTPVVRGLYDKFVDFAYSKSNR